MGQPKAITAKKTKCRVALKPELKNDMVKKKPAFHWNKPPKPEVKTTFFESKREDWFEPPESDSVAIPGLQIADFTVSRARVRGRSRKVSLDENSLLSVDLGSCKTQSPLELCSSKTEPATNPTDLSAANQIKASHANNVDTNTPITSPSNSPFGDYHQSVNSSGLLMPIHDSLFSDIFYSSSDDEEVEPEVQTNVSWTMQNPQCAVGVDPRELLARRCLQEIGKPKDNNNQEPSTSLVVFSMTNNNNNDNSKKQLENKGFPISNLEQNNPFDRTIVGGDVFSSALRKRDCSDTENIKTNKIATTVKQVKQPQSARSRIDRMSLKQISDDQHGLAEDGDGESDEGQDVIDVNWPTRSDLNHIQKELADARAKRIAYMALIMALDNIKLGIPW